MKVSLDFETYSEAPLKETGAWVYAEHPSTDVICMGYAYGDQDPQLWLPGMPLPDFVTHPENYELHAWNSFFEYCIWHLCLDWPAVPITQWHDSMARAAVMALPLSLGACAKVLCLPQDKQKDARGRYLIQRMCKPFRGERNRDVAWLTEFYEYCLQDVVVERAVGDMLLPLRQSERRVWELDQMINIRGVKLDHAEVANARVIITKETEALNAEVFELTDGRLTDVGKREKVMEVCSDFGFHLTSYTKDFLARTLERDDLHPVVRRLLEIRQKTGKTSTAKYASMASVIADDGRVHGLLQYHAASTGRWGGRLVQPQNLPRPSIDDTDAAISLFLHQDPDLLTMLYDDAMETLSSCLRGMFVASEGNRLVVSDYSAIEGRVLAWLAGEQHTLKDYRDGKDQYKVCATWMFNKPYDAITKDERNAGKPADLGMGFGGGIGAFDQFAKIYQVDYNRLYDAMVPTATPDEIEKAHWSATNYLKRAAEPMPFDHAVAADLAKQKWRRNRPATVEFWRDVETAAIAAVREPGSRFAARGVTYCISPGAKSFLSCKLPSGRCLFYARPSIKPGTFDKPALHFWGVDSVTKQWCQQATYSGKLVENITQAVARDLLAAAMVRIENAGYPVVLSVHDELIADVPERFVDLDEFNRIMCVLPAWAVGLPVASAGYVSQRYRKD